MFPNGRHIPYVPSLSTQPTHLTPPDGHLLEFPLIRVDCFTSPRGTPWLIPSPDDSNDLRPAPRAQLFLLTHVHSDHLLGLSDNFTGRIVCSHDTKRMLLRLEAERERSALAKGVKEQAKRKYDGLRARVLDVGTKHERVVDNIVCPVGFLVCLRTEKRETDW